MLVVKTNYGTIFMAHKPKRNYMFGGYKCSYVEDNQGDHEKNKLVWGLTLLVCMLR